MELMVMILYLVCGSVVAGGFLIEGILAVLERVKAMRSSQPMASGETHESPLGSALRRPIGIRFRNRSTRPGIPSAGFRTSASS